MPYFPIKKKYPTTETSTLCMATARPAVSNPANVAKVLISVTKLKPTTTVTIVHRTIVRMRSN